MGFRKYSIYRKKDFSLISLDELFHSLIIIIFKDNLDDTSSKSQQLMFLTQEV